MRIACLHTAHSNIAVFDDAALTVLGATPRAVLHHHVRTDLLAAAEQAGSMTQAIADATRAALLALADETRADAVLLTCSTLGPAADGLAASTSVPMLRVDRALADQALAGGGQVVALCAVITTMTPTQQLFDATACPPGTRVDVRLVEGAWARFKAGDIPAYLRAIADAADEAYAAGARSVALAQASMAAAAGLTRSGKTPCTSPAAGLQAALTALRA